MAKVGTIYLGGKDPDILTSEHSSCGIAFLLKSETEIDYIYYSQDCLWQVEIKKNHNYVVARSRDSIKYEDLIVLGLKYIQRCLDIIAVKKLGILMLDHPEIDHITIFSRNNKTILRTFSIGTLPLKSSFSIEVRDKQGNIKPLPKIPEPDWTWAFRYYRLSQASQDIFEAYRNLFLSLESLLNIIKPKSIKEHEKKWLSEALEEISKKVQITRYVPANSINPVLSFMDTQYEKIRCRLFHAKQPDALLPYEDLNPTDVLVAYEALLGLWYDIAGIYFGVPRGGGVVTYEGFKFWMDKVSKHLNSLCFTEDTSVPQKDDTKVSPRGLDVFKFEKFNYLGETNPGIVSWQGTLNILDTHKKISIHRMCTMIDKTVFNEYYFKNGLSPTGVDVFEAQMSLKLLNTNQPKTTF
jgi:hypothetical protein